jgi:phosphoserine phosphatase
MRYDIVAFDLDGVIVSERSSWEWVHSYFGVTNEKALQEFIERRIDDQEFMRRDIEMWMNIRPGVTLEDIDQILRGASITEGASETFKKLREIGLKSCVISGGIDLLANRIGEMFDIDKVLANGLTADERGTLLGEGILRVELWNKASALESVLEEFGVEPERCVAVGNSWVDVTMFEVTGYSIAFNPLDNRTRKAADVVVESDNLADILEHLG